MLGFESMRGTKLFAVIGTCSILFFSYKEIQYQLPSLLVFLLSVYLLKSALIGLSLKKAVLFWDSWIYSTLEMQKTIKQRLHVLNNVIKSYQKMNHGILKNRRTRTIIKTGSIYEAKIDPAHKLNGELQLPNVKYTGVH
jgi:hypothetical protein